MVVAVTVVALVSGGAAQGARAAAASPQCPVVVGQSTGGDLVAIGLDRSASMRRSDPRGARFVAVQRAAELLALAAVAPPRIALVGFSTRADTQVPATPLLEALPRLNAALADRSLGGRTDFARLFRTLGSIAAPAKRPLIIVVTDARSNGPGGSLAGQFAEIRRSMVALGGARVVLVVIDRDGRLTPGLERRWRDLGVEIVRVGDLGGGCLERLLPALVTANAGLSAREFVLPRRGDAEEFSVPKFAERVVVTAASHAPAAIEVAGPNGRPLARLIGRAGVVRVPGRPPPGAWSVRLAQGTDAAVTVDIGTVRAELTDLAREWPQGAPLTLRAHVTSLSGTPLPPDASVAVEAAVADVPLRGRPPAARPIPLLRTGPTTFTAAEPIDTAGGIPFDVVLKVRSGATDLLSLAPTRVAPRPLPYLAVVRKEVRSRDPLTVQLELRREGRPLDPADALGNAATTVASASAAQLFTPDGTALGEPVRLRHVAGPRFEARFPARPSDDQGLVVAATLVAQDRSGRAIDATTTWPVTATPSLVDRVLDFLPVLGVAAAAALILGVSAWFARPRGGGARYRVPPSARGPAREGGCSAGSVALHKRVRIDGSGWPWREATVIWMGIDSRAYARWGRIPRRRGRVELELVGAGRMVRPAAIPRRRRRAWRT